MGVKSLASAIAIWRGRAIDLTLFFEYISDTFILK